MANAVFETAQKRLISGDIDWLSDNIKVALISATNLVRINDFEYLTDITKYCDVIATTELNDKTITADTNAYNASDVTFDEVKAGFFVTGLVIYKDTGWSTLSPLVSYIDDCFGALPLSTNGGDIVIRWDNGTNKIFINNPT